MNFITFWIIYKAAKCSNNELQHVFICESDLTIITKRQWVFLKQCTNSKRFPICFQELLKWFSLTKRVCNHWSLNYVNTEQQKERYIYNRSKKLIRKRRKSDRRGYRSFIREPASDGTSCWKSGTGSKSRFIQITYKTDKIKNKNTRITRNTQGKIITVGIVTQVGYS